MHAKRRASSPPRSAHPPVMDRSGRTTVAGDGSAAFSAAGREVGHSCSWFWGRGVRSTQSAPSMAQSTQSERVNACAKFAFWRSIARSSRIQAAWVPMIPVYNSDHRTISRRLWESSRVSLTIQSARLYNRCRTAPPMMAVPAAGMPPPRGAVLEPVWRRTIPDPGSPEGTQGGSLSWLVALKHWPVWSRFFVCSSERRGAWSHL